MPGSPKFQHENWLGRWPRVQTSQCTACPPHRKAGRRFRSTLVSAISGTANIRNEGNENLRRYEHRIHPERIPVGKMRIYAAGSKGNENANGKYRK
jgi:hypothetical protein